MEDENAYTYTPLVEPHNSIRLIRILSIAPRPICQFSTESLTDSPVFSALSYTWGDSTATEPITVDGGTVYVTANLANAIRDVYGHWSKGDLIVPGHEQWLWADALCIDQQNMQEKNHQVSLMKELYSSAYQVFAWLGNDDALDTGKAIDATNFVLSMISRLPGFDYIYERTLHGEILLPKPSGELDIPMDSFHALTDLEWVNDHYQQMGPVKTFQELIRLSDAPYWSRLWIVQELVLAQSAILLCGSRSINWSTVCCVYSWLKLCQLRYGDIDYQGPIPIEEWVNFALPDIPRRLKDISLCKTVVALRNALDSSRISSRHSLSILEVRYNTFLVALRHQATNPKDYVYALAGVTGVSPTIDYNFDTTPAQVYREFISDWLQASRELPGEDTETDHTTRCRLWFLVEAGVGLPWSACPGLPSWAPNFSGIANAMHSQAYCTTWRWSPEDVSLPFLAAESATLREASLFCTTGILDRIESTGPIIKNLDDTPTWGSDEDAWLLWIYDNAAASVEGNKASASSVLSKIVQLVPLESCEWPGYPQDLAFELLIADLKSACTKARAISHLDFFEKLGIVPHTESPPVAAWLRRRFPTSPNSDSDVSCEGPLPKESIYSTTLAYERSLGRWHGLIIAFTETGLAGIFPPLTRTDDLVAVLHEYDRPVVLRKFGDGYQFVGACDIPGFNNDKVCRMLRDGETKMERIEIY